MFVLELEIPLASSGRLRVWIGLAAFAPTGQSGKEGLDGRVNTVGVQLVLRVAGDQAHQVLGFEPETFVTHRAPEKHEGMRVHLSRRVGQGIELVGCAEMDATDVVLRHTNSDRLLRCSVLVLLFGGTTLGVSIDQMYHFSRLFARAQAPNRLTTGSNPWLAAG